MNYNTKEINHLIRHRRSVFPRDYTGEKVDDTIIKQMLENANWAPTHGKTEPWRFFIFTGDSIQKLAQFQSEKYKELTPEVDFKKAKYEKLAGMPLRASHIIAIVMKRQESEKIPEIEEIEAVACAVQNMHLTAAAYGVGAYWASGGVTYKQETKDFLGLNEKDKILGFFYVGVPEGEIADSKRGSIEEKVTWM